jgi:hypothetical protein
MLISNVVLGSSVIGMKGEPRQQIVMIDMPLQSESNAVHEGAVSKGRNYRTGHSL